MSVPRWELTYGWDGPLFDRNVGGHKVDLPDKAIVVLARDYDSLRAAYDRLKRMYIATISEAR